MAYAAGDAERQLQDANDVLLDKIVELCQSSERDEPEVIMMIGLSGAGKSAFINTIYKTLTGQYYQIAKPGTGDAQTVTLDLHRFKNVGVLREHIQKDDRQEKIENILEKLPHIYDCAGLGDSNTPELRELLELLLGGFIPPDKNFEEVQKLQNDNGVGCLKEVVFPESKKEWAVTKVVFVQSCTAGNIPHNLIDCLNDVMKITDPSTLQRKYTPDVFVVISRYDCVQPSAHGFCLPKGAAPLTIQEFETIEDELAAKFNIIGAKDSNRIRWCSYTDDTGTDEIPHIRNMALRFVKKMMEPGGLKQVHNGEIVVGSWQKIGLFLFRARRKMRYVLQQDVQVGIPTMILLGIVFAIVGWFIYWLLSVGVKN